MSFKIFHTSDWHLGKRLYKAERLDEQKLFLSWLIEEIKKEKIDLLLIAGDIFDTPFPPTEALKLYFDFLRTLSDETNCQLVLIAGNHDSGRFLEAPLPFLREKNIHIFGSFKISNLLTPLILKNESGNEVEVYSIPFFRNHELHDLAKETQIDFKEENLTQFFDQLFKLMLPPKTRPRILLSHHQYGSAEADGSELTLSISGMNSIPIAPFKEHFDYIALGHIHRQTKLCDKPNIIYSGSPIPWRFSETNNKMMYAIEIAANTHVSTYPIPVFRNIFRLTLSEKQWEKEIEEKFKNSQFTALTPFVEVAISLTSPSPLIGEGIRKLLKNFNCELLAIHTDLAPIKEDSDHSHISWRDLRTEELFGIYYQEKYPKDELPLELKQSFNELIVKIQGEEK